jgi:hypothetical protein
MEPDTIALKCFIHSKVASVMEKNVHTVSFTFIHEEIEHELIGDCPVKEINNLFGDNKKIYQVDLAGEEIMFREDGTNDFVDSKDRLRDFWNRLVKEHGFEKIKE